MLSARYCTAMLGGLAYAATAAAAAAAIANTTSCTLEDITPSTELTWCPCGTNFFCAKLNVPLDYKNPSLGRAAVPLVKYAAASNSSDGPYQGMVLLIPGGPGGSGVELVQSNGSLLQTVVGTNWDIVSFDPRGIANSEPLLDCALNASSTSGEKTRRDGVPRVSDSFYHSYLDYGRELGDLCAQRSGGDLDAGPHMTTATVARDIISITDAYACTAEGRSAARNSSMLNLYGVSYGTMIGQTTVSMFPERVGHAILDGVISPQSYLSGWAFDAINDLDGVLALFFIYCNAAGPSMCPYATGNSAQDIFTRFRASFTQLDARKAAAEHWSNATEIEEALLTLKYSALNAAYYPIQEFPGLAQGLVGLETALRAGKLTQWTEQVIAETDNPGPAGVPHFEWVLGVLCSDENDLYYGWTLEDYQSQIQSLEAQSIIGEMWTRNALGCAGWKIKSNDVFKGPFGGDTAAPILFLSNTYDPVAPIVNSRLGAPQYKNAQIIIVDGAGHTSTATENECAWEKVHAYFQSDQLPGADNFCATETTPFGAKVNGTLQENIRQAGLTNLHF